MKPSKISELLEKFNRTANNADFSNLSKLELDLMMQQLRDLYTELDAAKNIVGHPDSYRDNNSKEEIKTTKRILNPNENILLNEPEVKKEPVKEFVGDNTNKGKEPVVKVETKQNNPKSSINESVQSVSSLNEKHKPAVKEVHKKLSTKPLKDLIDLNKKFILLNELFKGNGEAFSAAVRHIDSVDNFTEAESFIKAELSSNHYWDESSQAVRMFMKLVKQKFGEE